MLDDKCFPVQLMNRLDESIKPCRLILIQNDFLLNLEKLICRLGQFAPVQISNQLDEPVQPNRFNFDTEWNIRIFENVRFVIFD